MSDGPVVSRPEWSPYVILNGASQWIGSYPTFREAHRLAHDPITQSEQPRPLVIVNVPGMRLWRIDAHGCEEMRPASADGEWTCPLSAEIRDTNNRIERRHRRD
jgi:hypothetical protein